MLTKGLYLKEHPNVFFPGRSLGLRAIWKARLPACWQRAICTPVCRAESCRPADHNDVWRTDRLYHHPNKDFQPMGANMGILPRTEEIDTIRDKRERYMALSDAAQAAMRAWAAEAEH